MKRILGLTLAMLMAATMLSACNGGTAQSEGNGATVDDQSASSSQESVNGETGAEAGDTALNGSIIFATHRTDHAEGSLKALADEFMALNPGTKVEIEGIKEAAQTLAPRLASGEAPDIFFDFGVQRSELARYFLPLDDMGYNEDNTYVVRGADGNIYEFVSATAYNALVYNRAVFNELGIELPTTMDELYAACETIKAAGIVPFASNFKDSWAMQYFQTGYEPQVNGNGNWMNDLVGKDALLSDDNAAIQGLEILNTLKDKGFLEPDLTSTNWDQFKLDFAQGKMAMCYMGTWICPQMVDSGMKAEDVGVMPLPGVTYQDVGGDYGYGISADTKAPEVAKAFLSFLWEESRFANATGANTPLKDVEPEDPFAKELLSYKLPTVQVLTNQDEITNILAEMRFDWGTLNQEYLIAADKQAVIDKYNQSFNDAKAALGL